MNRLATKQHEEPAQIMVVDDHPSARQSMVDILAAAGYQLQACASAHEALAQLEKRAFDVVLTDLNMPGMNGLEFIKAMQHQDTDAHVIMVTAYASIHSAVEAMRYGAFDYIQKPLKSEQLEGVVARALRQNDAPAGKLSCEAAAQSATMIGSSRPMQRLRALITQVAATSETVLITGENGTGKELVARSVHAASARADHKMISLNCPVLSAHLLESELFGHERGAFTSAEAPRVGRFELADQSTILLDEITELDLPLQAKLLRVLQEKTFERVGASHSIQVDVRVLATTNRLLREEVAAGNFREDLYFRLAVVELQTPSLRERREDLPELIAHFQTLTQQRVSGEAPQFDPTASDLLCEYHWPGNVRELENIVTRAAVFSSGQAITADEIRPWLIDAQKNPTTAHASTAGAIGVGVSLQDMERQLIMETLEQYGGHRQKSAEALGIGVRTLSGKLRSYGLAPRAKTFSKAA